MATNDVPGAVAAHADELHAGCWAEHEDGSLIFVKGAEGDRVVYEIYDMKKGDKPIYYPDAMEKKEFEKFFSLNVGGKTAKGAKKERWTWHDKTPFPWERVIGKVDQMPRYADVRDELSAAERVAKSLNLRARELSEEELTPRAAQARSRGIAVFERLMEALGNITGKDLQ